MAVVSSLITRSDNIKLTLHVNRNVSVSKTAYYTSIGTSVGIRGIRIKLFHGNMHIWNPRTLHVETDLTWSSLASHYSLTNKLQVQ